MIRHISPSVKSNNGVFIPQIGFGTAWISNDEGKTIDVILKALEAGYRHFDTAANYHNESAVGKAIQQSGIPREDIFIATKIWNDDVRKEWFAAALDESLEKLGMDYVDMYMLHWPVPMKYVKAWKGMEKLYETKKVKSIGVCNFTINQLQELRKISDILPVVNQFEFNPRFAQPELREYCDSNNIACEAFAPLGTGFYVNDVALQNIGEKHGKTFAQVVLRWDIQKGMITIPKASHDEYIYSNIDIFDFELDSQDIAEIDAMDIGRATFEFGTPDCFDF
jgi:diketogulonate reductase-like aldo/keto reductase